MFAGVGYSGDMRDPRHATWLAVTELRGERLRVALLPAGDAEILQQLIRRAETLDDYFATLNFESDTLPSA